MCFAQAAALISDADLHLSHLSLQLANELLVRAPAVSARALQAHIYPRMLALARSSLLQGAAQASLIQLFRAAVQASVPGMSYSDTFAQLYVAPSSDLTKQGLSNLSKCIGGCTCTPQAAQQSLQRFTADLQAAGSSEGLKQLALLCLGEVGQGADLSAIPGLQGLVLGCFESRSEDTKLAAAYALGHIAVGNMQAFLPLVLQQSESSKHQYLLLAALKETVVVFANRHADFSPYLSAVLPVLLQQCRSEEESVRSIVAECLGVLTALLPEQVVPVLLQLSQDEQDKLSRRLIGNALRFSLSRAASSPAAVEAITAEMQRFLPLLQDSDLDVKKAALLMVNTAVHHNPATVEAHLGTVVIPALIETLQIKLERIVDLGPFKHRVRRCSKCRGSRLRYITLFSFHGVFRWTTTCLCARSR
jgi:cullin-associated NEDD8-dissociated protein 1